MQKKRENVGALKKLTEMPEEEKTLTKIEKSKERKKCALSKRSVRKSEKSENRGSGGSEEGN